MHTIRPASFGSVSTGTLSDYDLIRSFSSELRYQIGRQSSAFPRKELNKLLRKCFAWQDADDASDTETDGADLVSSLADALEQFAQPYGYFGTLPGDGADFGFWISDPRDCGFDGLEVEDTADVPRDYRGEVLHINDHGNMTLYVARASGLKEIWAVV